MVRLPVVVTLSFGQHIDAAAFAIEDDFSIDQGVQRVIVSLANALAGVKFGADLANDDVSSPNRLAAKFLDASPLSV